MNVSCNRSCNVTKNLPLGLTLIPDDSNLSVADSSILFLWPLTTVSSLRNLKLAQGKRSEQSYCDSTLVHYAFCIVDHGHIQPDHATNSKSITKGPLMPFRRQNALCTAGSAERCCQTTVKHLEPLTCSKTVSIFVAVSRPHRSLRPKSPASKLTVCTRSVRTRMITPTISLMRFL